MCLVLFTIPKLLFPGSVSANLRGRTKEFLEMVAWNANRDCGFQSGNERLHCHLSYVHLFRSLILLDRMIWRGRELAFSLHLLQNMHKFWSLEVWLF